MPVERIDHMRALASSRKEEPRGMTTDLAVGEFITLRAQVGGADLFFALQAKVPHELAKLAGYVDKVEITLTIEPKHGQRARVRVQAPRAVRIERPAKPAD